MPVLKTSISLSVLISGKLNQARSHKERSSFNIHEPRGSSVPRAVLFLKGMHRSSIHICWACRMLKQRRQRDLQKGRIQIGRHRLQVLLWCNGWEEGEVDELGPCCWIEVRREHPSYLGNTSLLPQTGKDIVEIMECQNTANCRIECWEGGWTWTGLADW